MKNILFATLDPKTRQIQVNEGFNLIISDTVGFIQNYQRLWWLRLNLH